ncbi:hypothetical protein ACF0H5_008265 [Mactra antiquata]
MSGLRKYTSMIFGKTLIGRSDNNRGKRGGRQRAISESNHDSGSIGSMDSIQEESKSYRRTRRVTFADIDELHTRFGTPTTESIIEGH